MSAINDEQCKWIESLTCERLSDNFDNQDVILDFDNKYDTLVSHLHENAIKEDENNSGAYYLVKSKDCKALFYFSLRCGLLYEDVLNSDLVDICKANAGEILMTEELEEKIKNYQIDNSLSNKQLKIKLADLYNKLKKQKKAKRADDSIEQTAQIRLVLDTIPAIELQYFCKNEAYDGFDEEFFKSRTLGEIIFWFKIFPIIEGITKMVGCKYIYLFAADDSENRNLTNYYKTKLKFDDQSEWGVNKPANNNSCIFLCLNIAEARKYRDELKDKFNTSENDDII